MLISEVLNFVYNNAVDHQESNPTLGTLLEEVAELARSLEGKHDDPPELELLQIAGICVNMLKHYTADDLYFAITKNKLRKLQVYDVT